MQAKKGGLWAPAGMRFTIPTHTAAVRPELLGQSGTVLGPYYIPGTVIVRMDDGREYHGLDALKAACWRIDR